TNPVYVILNNRRPYQQAALDAWVAKIDGQMDLHKKRKFPAQAAVLAYFQKARDVLLRIRAQQGFAADEEPTAVLDEKSSPDVDVGRLDISEAELKAYLRPTPATPAEDAVQQFEVAPGYEMQLVAAEPLVASPVAAAFDEQGQLYVCEMRDYPFKPSEGKDPLGTVRLLRDTNADGRFDQATIFADKLLWAAGVVPWKGGVYVAASPDIWYLKDTDGDGVADVRRKVFTGFGTNNQQGMVNNLQFGLDHWIYGSTGPNGGMISKPDQPEFRPVPIQGRDFRFHPETLEFQAITGTVQFGNTFDDFGNRFTCSESQPLEHIVLPDHYLARNPFLASPGGIHNIAPGPVPIFRISPIERWREIRSLRRIQKNERAATAPGASHHVVDAAAGVTIYRGGTYPADWYGQAFVGDGQNNLIHRRRLIPQGLTFGSERVDVQTEVVRSPDIWFRPVNALNAPDGTLYFLDMSREYLESIHIPLDVARHLDLKSGRENGRIYRLAPRGFRSPQPPALASLGGAELLTRLESPHGWYRDTAHRLLYERPDLTLVPELKVVLANSKFAPARVLALWTLAGWNRLDAATILLALQDSHPGVQENAIRLSEPWLKSHPEVLNRVIVLADSDAARVRFQAAFSLGEATGPQVAQVLAKLARRSDGDAWMRTALLSSVANVASELFEILLLDAGAPQSSTLFAQTPAGAALLAQLAQLIGVRNHRSELRAVLQTLQTPRAEGVATAMLLELGRGLKRVGRRIDPADFDGATRDWLNGQFQHALQTVSDAQAPGDARARAVEFLSCFPAAVSRGRLQAMLTADAEESVLIAVMRSLVDDSEVNWGDRVLEMWNQLSPESRRVALESLLSREDLTKLFLEAALTGRVSIAAVDSIRREGLKSHRNSQIRSLADQVFCNAQSESRQAVIASYQSVLQMRGRVEAGGAVFAKNCASCHQVGGKGVNIGPNLASNAAQSAASLLTHILDPNQYVLPSYVVYVAVDTNGRTHTGLLDAQTATSITLKKEKGETVTLLKNQLEELTSTGKSLMPEGLEKAVSPEEMADLIAFLQEMTKKSPGDPNSERDRGTVAGTLIEP
ncbi:MAG: c-type cytochrome, partial [Planctomycetes bacterium]|nr:c-type cytochrome [Planctomycetota bacterium]